MAYVDTSTGEIVTVYLFDMKMDNFIRAHIHMYGFFGWGAHVLSAITWRRTLYPIPEKGMLSWLRIMKSWAATTRQPSCWQASVRFRGRHSWKDCNSNHRTAEERDFLQFWGSESCRYKKALRIQPREFPKTRRELLWCLSGWKTVPASIAVCPLWNRHVSLWQEGVNIDYHVVFEYNRYSCPYQYARKSVDLKVTGSTVEFYSGSAR